MKEARHSILDLYLRDIRQLPLLAQGEADALARRIQQGDAEARLRLIQGNLRLVVKIAWSFEGRGLDLLDLINEGNIGLMKAAERFDPARGRSFSWYAGLRIRLAIRRALTNQAHTVRIPSDACDRLVQIHWAGLRLAARWRREATDTEVASEVELTPKEVRRLRTASLPPVPLDQPVEAHSRESVLDLLPDERALAPSEIVALKNERELLEEILRKLNSMERAVLWHRFGMDGGDTQSLAKVGERLGITCEWARQLQNRALKRIRNILTWRIKINGNGRQAGRSAGRLN